MHLIGTLAGTGTLRADNKVFGRVQYDIRAWRERNGLKSASGTLSGPGGAVTQAMLSNQRLYLDLETGGSAIIMLRSLSGGIGEFLVSGPVPGILTA